MPFSSRIRRQVRSLGLGLCGLGLVGVGVLASVEGLYRWALWRLPAPPTPSERLPLNLARARWSLFEPGADPRVEPVWPWTAVATLSRVFTSDPREARWPEGWRLATRVADTWSWSLKDARPRRPHERLALAIWLTRHWSAEELLAYQTRRARLGHDVHDMGEGARRYLGKDLSELTVAEAALLVSIDDAAREDWREHPECFLERLRPRRDGLLHRMREAGVLTQAEETAARAWPVTLRLTGFAAHPCPP
jgi:hypothetical protein